MMNRGVQKVFSMLLALCLVLSAGVCAVAESTADFEQLIPLMDLVCAASLYSPNAPETISGADSSLTVSFTDAFIKVGQTESPEVGVTEAMLSDTSAQADLLGKIFAAQIPQLEPVVMTDDVNGFIGFHPVHVVKGADGTSVQIIGEMYLADKPMREMSEADYANITWQDRALFTFQSDASALNGFRLTAFSVGTDLEYEEAFQAYADDIAVEYESSLGFMLLYPAVFTDDLLVENEYGVSAELADGSAGFFAKRSENANGETLADYVNQIADGINGSVAVVNEEMQNATLTYTTQEGQVVFDVFVVTEQYIYQAELHYQSSLMDQYSMYTTYLENSFVVNELSQG